MAKLLMSKAIELLDRQRNRIPDLIQLSHDSPEFNKWKRDTKVSIANIFGENSDGIKDFMDIRYITYSVFGDPDNDQILHSQHVKGLEKAGGILSSMIEEINTFWPGDNQTQPVSGIATTGRTSTNDVFIVHGRDEGTKEAVARFLTKLGLGPIILHEQPNQGRTVIEKFEQNAEVPFAVVLLTPDDVGSLWDDQPNLRLRARQNVIFELGYFTGSLGRERVCALTKGDLEEPSDYEGVVYIPLDDSGAWKMGLVKELKSAGLDVDANRAL